MKILLLGANGQLGRSFVEDGTLASLGEIVTATRDGRRFDGLRSEAIDLAQPDRLAGELDALQPDVVINTAAYTAVDRAEQEETLATTVNGHAVGILGRWAASHGALVVHYSTDYVFDGKARTPYRPDAPTCPLGAYGRSKLAGERALMTSGAAHLIFRTAWVYAAHGRNFLRTMLRLGQERDVLGVVGDQIGTPTSTEVIVAGTLAALRRWCASTPDEQASLQGIHHLVTRDHTSWHGFASAIFDEATARGVVDRPPHIHAITTADYPTPAQRPSWSVLDARGMHDHFGFVAPSWREALQPVVASLVDGRPGNN
ncbi:MAG TPA: dTDP-4-dehydrorhamnose reductase [Dyella sp.]|nr:dTDP-4-dehydrorhamnose reductase [Dyella sp.]